MIKRRKQMLIGLLLVLLVFIGIGYAVLSQTITINAGGHVKGKINIYIDSITPTNINGGAEDVSHVIGDDKLSAAIEADFTTPGDYIDYDVVVKNDGSLDAKITNVNFAFNQEKDYFSYTTDFENGKVLAAGDQVLFTIRIKFNEQDNFEKPTETIISTGNLQLFVEQYDPNADPDEPDEPEEDWVFKVDSDGLITDYNYKYGTNVKVPYSVDGIVVRSIDSNSFLQGNVFLYQIKNSNDSKLALVAEDSEVLEAVRTYVESMQPGLYIYYSSEEAMLEDNPGYWIDGDPLKVYYDITTGTFGGGIKLTSLDLSEATGLQTIEQYSFKVDLGDASQGECGENYPASKCSLGTLTELILPSSGSLTIGKEAFRGNKIIDLVIPESVTSIARGAFQYNHITSLTLPDTNITISQYAFDNNLLQTLTVPGNIATLPSDSFTNNIFSSMTDSRLITVEYTDSNLITRFNNNWYTIGFPGSGPKGITYTDASCFAVDQNNQNIIVDYVCSDDIISIPDSINGVTITEIADNAFQEKGLIRVTIPSTITTIGYSAFYNNSLTSVTIPASVTSIGDSAFKNNNSYDHVTINYGGDFNTTEDRFDSRWTKIFDSSTYTQRFGICYNYEVNNDEITITSLNNDCKNLKNYDIPDTYDGKDITVIGGHVFSGVYISSLHLPYHLREIQNSAFRLTTASGLDINTIDFPDTLTTIGDNAFEKRNFSTLTLPESLESIGASAFRYNKLSRLVVPANVATIGDFAFKDNTFSSGTDSKVITINYNQTNSITRFNSRWTIIGFPGEGVTSYKFGCFYVDVENMSRITEYDVSDDSCPLDNINIPSEIEGNNITIIGESAFENIGAGAVTLPSTITTIEKNAFKGNDLTEITIPNSVTTIGEGAFANNDISNLVFEQTSSVTTIGKDAFNDNNLSDLHLPQSVTSVGENAFFHNNFESITIDNTTLLNNLSSTAANWRYVGFPESLRPGVTYSYGTCFAVNNTGETITAYNVNDDNCSYDMVIPDQINNVNITKIANSAFSNIGLTSVTFGANLQEIGDYAFYGNKLTSVALTNSIQSVGVYSFKKNKIESVTFQNNNVTIRTSAFEYNRITSLTPPGGRIETNAFANNLISSIDLSNVTSLSFSDGTYDIAHWGQFSNNLLTSITIPSTLIDLGTDTFANNMINTINYQEGTQLKYIGGFRNNQLRDVTIPNTVVSINGLNFMGPKPIEGSHSLCNLNVTSSSNNDYQNFYNFAYCEVTDEGDGTISGDVTNYIDTGYFEHNDEQNYTYFVPYVDMSVHKSNDSPTKAVGEFSNNHINELVFQATSKLQLIPQGTFSKNLISFLDMPSSVLAIDSLAFADNGIVRVSLFNTKFIGTYAFTRNMITLYNDQGTYIAGIRIPQSVEFIGKYAFTADNYYMVQAFGGDKEWCSEANMKPSITYIKLDDYKSKPSKLKYIGDYAFNSQLYTSMTIPSSVTYIGQNALTSLKWNSTRCGSYTKGNANITVNYNNKTGHGRNRFSGTCINGYDGGINSCAGSGTVTYAQVDY